MTAPIIPEVIQTRTLTDAGRKIVQQVVACNVPGCEAEMVVSVGKTLKPGDVILNMARRRGWHIEGDGRKIRSCPYHKVKPKLKPLPQTVTGEQTAELAERFKGWFREAGPLQDRRRLALIDKLAELGLSKVTEAKTQLQFKALMGFLDSPALQEPPMAQKNPELVAASQGLVPLAESLKLPTDAARAQRRKVFHEIEGCYAQGRYVEGFSDETIAKKLMVAVGMVTEIREMNFGPAGPDPRIAELRKQIEGLETRVGQIEDAALAVVDQAEKKAVELRRDIASLKAAIFKLEGVL